MRPWEAGLFTAADHDPSARVKARPFGLQRVLAVLLLMAVVGSCVFHELEREAELKRYELNRAIYGSLTDMVDFEHCHDPAFRDLGFCREHEELEARLERFFNRAGNSLTDRRLWTHLGSFLFVVQLGSTVGYEAPPQTAGGQLAAILFGVVFIPLFGCALILSSRSLLGGAELVLQGCLGPPGGGDLDLERSRLLRLTLLLVAALWPGMALVFMLLEGWSYANALFFCFVTMTTVGFGTDVPASPVSKVLCVLYIYAALSLTTGILERMASLRRDEEESLLLPGRHLKRFSSPWLCMLAVVFLCLCGAFVFPALERGEEVARYARARTMYEDLNDLAHFGGCEEDGLIRTADFCKNAGLFKQELARFFGPDTPNSMVDRENWTAFGAASFMLSLASTVGYASHSPHTRAGKIAMVLFGLVAIPLFLQQMLATAALVSRSVERRLAQARGREAGEKPTLALSLLILAIWLGGSLVFWALEAGSGWSFTTALYFCFVTLSGCGFSNVMPRSLAAKAFTQVYIVVGLGMVASLMSVLVEMMYESSVSADEPKPEPDSTAQKRSS